MTEKSEQQWTKETLWEMRQVYLEAGRTGGVEGQIAVLDLFAATLNVKRSQMLLAIKNATPPAQKGSGNVETVQ